MSQQPPNAHQQQNVKPTATQGPRTKPAKLHRISITTDKEADAAAHAAINPCMHLLPNADDQRDMLGKSTWPSVKKSGLVWPTGPAREHPAAELLDSYATNGCLVDCGPDWSC